MIWNEGLITFGYDEIEEGDKVVIADEEILHVVPPNGKKYYQDGMDRYCGDIATVTKKVSDGDYGGFYLMLDAVRGHVAWSPWMVEKIDAKPKQPINTDINLLFSEEAGLNVEH